ncbi:tyrosine-type recombinase/integrase [Deinococcus hopiensis]|uniref:Integrase/recombinase XerC n=1 Tax=Deinococcus hopiensis KR-140 TaxID=695939 RepID=A0A1W1U9M8_9DEIO|nr:tyrosine-type recombinase/integrase [Deinococcus hopiensis]SMB77743.1 integrase/recombinase XerC [Deinococcus hopiensis KR-140]
MTLAQYNADLHHRTSSWSNLHRDERRRRAVKACAEKDAEVLWEIVEWYLTQHAQAGLLVSPHTQLSYRTGTRQLVAFMAEHAWNVLSPEREDVQGYVNSLLASGKSIATVQARAAAGRTLYAALREVDATKAVPFEGLRVPKDRRHPLEKNAPYPRRRMEDVLEKARDQVGRDPKRAARHLEVWALLLLLAHTGLRIDEALSLGWRDVHLDEDDARLVVRSGKGRKSREVPVSPRLAAALIRFQALPRSKRHVGDQLFPYRTWRGAAYHVKPLFQREDGSNDFRGFHAIRKFMGSRLYDTLGDFTAVAEVLGHASVDTTRGYVRVGVNRAKKAVADW